MASKYEIAGYLVSLHTLLEAQSKGNLSVPSSVLAAEYEKHWRMLKDEISKENEDDSRQSQPLKRSSDQTRANLSRGESGRR